MLQGCAGCVPDVPDIPDVPDDGRNGPVCGLFRAVPGRLGLSSAATAPLNVGLAPLVLRIVQVLSRDVSDVLDVSRMSQMCRMLQMLQMDGIRSGCLGCCPDVDGMLQILKLSR